MPFPTLALPLVGAPYRAKNITCDMLTCDLCASVVGCGWCVTMNRCMRGGYVGPDTSTMCPRRVPDDKISPLDAGVQQNWYVRLKKGMGWLGDV